MLQQSDCAIGPTSYCRPRILLAEDMPTMREIAKALLVRAGFEVDSAADGSEALGLLGAQRYDLVLMDVHMPGIDGITVARTVRTLDGPNCAVPMLAVTAETSPERLRGVLEAGMDGFLCKPFGRSQLLAAIEPWLVGKRNVVEPACCGAVD